MRAPVLLSALVLLLALAAPAAAQEPPRIAAGTKAGNLDVGGLTEAEAIAKLQTSYNASLGRRDRSLGGPGGGKGGDAHDRVPFMCPLSWALTWPT